MKPLIQSSLHKDALVDKTILITGASSGLGQTLAYECANHGATVILNGTNIDALNQAYDHIMSMDNPEPAILELDLRKGEEHEFKAITNVIQANVGELHGLIHCATHISELGSIRHLRLTDWQDLMKVNVIAPALLTQSCEPLFEASGSGSVILTSDSHATTLDAYWGGYAISKSALNAYSILQSNEWKNEKPFRINVVTPGPINSPLRSKTHPGEERNQLRSMESLLPTYLYLMSDLSVGISGENFG
ncbi:MAG: SDR family NAD(P)-dependent oxidoreductase [Burkholderiales bacterium]|nr:SDR family NAD(P)-dependent oxidoreductase [Burkholderiales bacterium]